MRLDVKVDERSTWLARVRCLPAPLAVPLVYPRLFALHTALSAHQVSLERERG